MIKSLFLINPNKYNIQKRTTKIILSISFLFISMGVFAQKGIISGTLFFEDGTPAIGASVHIENTSYHSYTDAKGFFEITEVPYNEYIIIIKFFDKKDETKRINLQNQRISLKHTLSYNETNDLDEVLVRGASKESHIERSGFAVNAIAMKTAQLQSIQANDVLDRSSGVRIRQNGGLGSHTHYNINGLSGSAIRIFIDGAPIESFGPSFSLNSIPTHMIERIEVYKGVVPVVLAGDALGGAINVILKDDFEGNSLGVSYSYGSFNTHQATLWGNMYNDKTGFVLNGSGFYNYSDNNYKVWGEQVYTTNPTTGDITYLKAKRFHDAYASGGFKVNAGFAKKKWADELLLGVIYSELDKDIQHGATMESVYGNRTSSQRTKQLSLSFKDDSFLSSKKLRVALFASYSDLKRQLTDTVPYIYDWDGARKQRFDSQGNFNGYYEYFSGAEAGNPTLEENIEKVYLGRATTHYTITKNHEITANFLYNKFTRNAQDPLRHRDIRDLEDTRFSNKKILGLGYAFEGFNNRLKASVFYKYFNQNIRIVEYKKESEEALKTLNDVNRTLAANGFGATVAYEVVPQVLLQLSAENSFRLPVSRELFGNLAQNLEPNYNLAPEKSKNLNLGVILGTFSFGKNDAKIKLNTFIRDTHNKIKLNVREDATDPTTEFINDDSYISKGFDLDVFYSYDNTLDFTGNFSVFNSRFNTQFDETGLPYNWYKDRERNAPFLTANGNLRYRFKNLFQKKSQTTLVTNLAYVHWFYRDWESLGGTGKDIIPTQLVTDIGITHTLPSRKISFAFDARNIFDRQVFDNYALQKPGRAFYIKINYTIF